MMDAKKALTAAEGDMTAAVEALRKKGQKIAASKSDRAVKEGAVGTYIHSNGKIASLVAVACETDFVARTDAFQELIKDLAMHVAAMNPTYLKPEDVPAEVVAKEQEIYREQLMAEGKPEAMLEKILPGKLKKFYSDVCFLEQAFVKDDSLTIAQVVESTIAKLGENIQVTAFSRLAV
jgi:elongation factor Ts